MDESLLRLVTTENISDYVYDGVYTAKVISAYDGDTCEVVFMSHENRLARETLRLYGINTPELRGGNSESREKAIAARKRLIEMVCGVSLAPDEAKKYFPDHRLLIKVKTHGKRDDFGRLLATLFPHDAAEYYGNNQSPESNESNKNTETYEFKSSFNHMLIEEGHAVEFKR